MFRFSIKVCVGWFLATLALWGIDYHWKLQGYVYWGLHVELFLISFYCITFVILRKDRLERIETERLKKRIADHTKELKRRYKSPGSGEINAVKPCETKDKWPQALQFKDERLNTFCRESVIPFQEILKEGFKGAIMECLKLLDDHGDCPSVVQSGYESNKLAQEPNGKESYEALASITLIRHTLHVAEKIIEFSKKENIDYQTEIGALLIVSLGHDLGKIPEKRSAKEKKIYHFVESKTIVSSFLPNDLPGRDSILEAIHNHHYDIMGSDAPLVLLLKKADQAARDLERNSKNPVVGEMVAHAAPGQKGVPIFQPIELAWLDREAFLQKIEQGINMVTNGKYSSFSHESIVYVRPDFIASCCVHLANENGMYHIAAVSQHQKNSIAFSIRTLFADQIHDSLGKTFIGRRYQIETHDQDRYKPGLYMPFKRSAFSISESELHARQKRAPELSEIARVLVLSTS